MIFKKQFFIIMVMLVLFSSMVFGAMSPLYSAVSDDSSASDLILLREIIDTFEGGGWNEVPSPVVFSEIDVDDYEDKVLLLVKDGKAKFVNVDYHHMLIGRLEYALNENDVIFERIEYSDIEDVKDLNDLFEGDEDLDGFITAVDDSSPNSDLLTLIEVYDELDDKYSFDRTTKLFSEVNPKLVNYVLLSFYEGRAVIIISEKAPSDAVKLGNDIRFILDDRGIPSKILVRSQVGNSDLMDLFESGGFTSPVAKKYPDLIISNVKKESTLVKESSFELPYIKFLVTIENVGDGDAIIKRQNGYYSQINVVINDILFGAPTLVKNDGSYEGKEVVIKAGDDKIIEILYADLEVHSSLKSGINTLELDLDPPFTTMEKGMIEEENENNNDFEFKFNLNSCDDSENGLSPYQKGTITLFGEKVSDECLSDSKIIEYSCDGGFIVKYGYLDCPQNNCVDGRCVREEIDVSEENKEESFEEEKQAQEPEEVSEKDDSTDEDDDCLEGECEKKGIISKILSWFGNLFN